MNRMNQLQTQRPFFVAYKGRTELDINPALGRNWNTQIGRTVISERIKDQQMIRLDNNKKGLSVGFGQTENAYLG